MHYKELPKVGNGIDISYQIAWRQTKRLLTRQGRKDCSELIVLREALELKTIDGFKYETGVSCVPEEDSVMLPPKKRGFSMVVLWMAVRQRLTHGAFVDLLMCNCFL